MFTIYIFADTYKLYKSAIEEYQKRMWKQLQIVHMKPEKGGSWEEVIKKETKKFFELMQKSRAFKVLLNPKWKILTTEVFYSTIQHKKHSFSQFEFYIWWANGLDYSWLEKNIDLSLSLSSFTFPHWLALAVLVEQLYRVTMIEKGTKYNK